MTTTTTTVTQYYILLEYSVLRCLKRKGFMTWIWTRTLHWNRMIPSQIHLEVRAKIQILTFSILNVCFDPDSRLVFIHSSIFDVLSDLTLPHLTDSTSLWIRPVLLTLPQKDSGPNSQQPTQRSTFFSAGEIFQLWKTKIIYLSLGHFGNDVTSLCRWKNHPQNIFQYTTELNTTIPMARMFLQIVSEPHT